MSKDNTVVVTSDGNTVKKVTMYEEFASKLNTGSSYVMRGYALRGQTPPYRINVTKETILPFSAAGSDR